MDDSRIIEELSRAVIEAGGQAAFSRRSGLSQSLISMTISGERPPGDAVANALGYVRRITVEYVRVAQANG